ncbi:DUF4189 domain-containing protein [Neisseria sicca]
MKHILLIAAMILSGFANANEMSNPCAYHPDLPGCAGNNRPMGQGGRVINIPNRWGAIYYNPANRAFGYSDNNTKGYRDAEKEALASCIKAGGGQNPIASDGKGCRLVTKNRNSCSAIAMGQDKGYAIESDDSLDELERKVLEACSEYSDSCKVRYSACSRHPDYLRY